MSRTWDAAQQAVVEVGRAVAQRRDPAEIASDREGAQRRADLFAHDELRRRLARDYPGVVIVSEEDDERAEVRPAEYWLIDPIDGTASWSGGYAGFVTQAAFIRDGVVQFGVIHAPVLQRTWTAARGSGALCNGVRLPVRGPVADPLVVVDNYPEPRGVCAELLDWLGQGTYIESGSLGLKAALVASGQADLFVKDVVVRDWDMAPALAVCLETGTWLSRADGTTFALSGRFDKEDGVIVAADEQLGRRVAAWLGNH